MDFGTLEARIRESRRFEVEIDGARFKVELPTDHACRVAIDSNRDAHGGVIGAKSSRQILDAAVIGWEGVKARHFHPEAGDDLIPFSTAARLVLLDVRSDIGLEITIAIAGRIEERRARMEASRKN